MRSGSSLTLVRTVYDPSRRRGRRQYLGSLPIVTALSSQPPYDRKDLYDQLSETEREQIDQAVAKLRQDSPSDLLGRAAWDSIDTWVGALRLVTPSPIMLSMLNRKVAGLTSAIAACAERNGIDLKTPIKPSGGATRTRSRTRTQATRRSLDDSMPIVVPSDNPASTVLRDVDLQTHSRSTKRK